MPCFDLIHSHSYYSGLYPKTSGNFFYKTISGVIHARDRVVHIVLPCPTAVNATKDRLTRKSTIALSRLVRIASFSPNTSCDDLLLETSKLCRTI